MDRIAKHPQRSTEKKMGQIAKVLRTLKTCQPTSVFRKSCETAGRDTSGLSRRPSCLVRDWPPTPGLACQPIWKWQNYAVNADRSRRLASDAEGILGGGSPRLPTDPNAGVRPQLTFPRPTRGVSFRPRAWEAKPGTSEIPDPCKTGGRFGTAGSGRPRASESSKRTLLTRTTAVVPPFPPVH